MTRVRAAGTRIIKVRHSRRTMLASCSASRSGQYNLHIDHICNTTVQAQRRRPPFAQRPPVPPPAAFSSPPPGSPPAGQVTISPPDTILPAEGPPGRDSPSHRRPRSWSRLRRRTSPPSRLFRPLGPPLQLRWPQLQHLPPSPGAQPPLRPGALPPRRRPRQPTAPPPRRHPLCKVCSRTALNSAKKAKTSHARQSMRSALQPSSTPSSWIAAVCTVLQHIPPFFLAARISPCTGSFVALPM